MIVIDCSSQALKIAEAEARLVKLRRDETLRAEIDALLVPAIESKSSELLEQHLHKASSASVTSKTIESARLLLGQLRSQGDKSRILILLKDSLRLRSVAVLEHVVKSAVDAGNYVLLSIMCFSLSYATRNYMLYHPSLSLWSDTRYSRHATFLFKHYYPLIC